MRRLFLAALAAMLVAPSGAAAADPIMPLAQVQVGAHCTALTVVQGTAITSFDVEILDVLDRDQLERARFLVRVSGPAVAATGIGPGFSGSPIYCADAAGVQRNIGAISAGIGEYGGTIGLATPIEAMLAEPVQPPSSAVRSVVPAPLVGSRPLATPLTMSGVSTSIATMFTRAARKAGRTLLASPASPRSAGYPPQPLVPGAAASVGYTSGDIELGAIGTVTYSDGPNVWLFGHPLDGAGRRSLFLQDAYIHTVVNNPVGAPDLSTYKLGSAGNDIGTVTGDGIDALSGRLGPLPPSFPLKVFARDRDTARSVGLTTQITDEGDIGKPTGPSILAIVGSAAAAEAASRVMRGAPARQSGDMCVKITLRERKEPISFCQRYAVEGTVANALAGALSTDFAQAAQLLDEYVFGTLHVTGVEIGMRLRRGLRQAYLTDVEGPSRARRGQRIKLRLKLRRTVSGVSFTKTIRLRIPRDLEPGSRTIKLAGVEADSGSDPDEEGELTFLFEDEAEVEAPPDSVEELADAIEATERYDGVTATIGGRDIEAYRDPNLRISGEARLELTVRR